MKYLYSVIVALGVMYMASCSTSNGSTGTGITAHDSVSKGDSFQVTIASSTGTVVDSYSFNDYTINGVAVITLYANIMYNHNDSLWYLNLQLIDQKMQHAGLVFAGTSTSEVGTYVQKNNSGTVIDYANGLNMTYAVDSGSFVTITQSTYPIRGSFYFNLSHNYTTGTATGSFKIFQ